MRHPSDDQAAQPLDLDAIREKLESKGGDYWRGLAQLSDSPEYSKWLEDEFPDRASLKDVDRRTFLKLAGASAVLAGLAGCRNLPTEKLVPYVKAPEDRLPGASQYFATVMPFGGFGFGVLARSVEGRPIKLEGNPDHPDSLGSSDAFVQAEMLNLYDPDRLAVVTKDGQVSTLDEMLVALRAALATQGANRGAGVRILTETTSSPTMARMVGAVQKQFPAAQWVRFDSVSRDQADEGTRLAFGEPLNVSYDLSKADVILSLDADLFGGGPLSVRMTRDFTGRRTVKGTKVDLNRLYAIEGTPTLTGAVADHRLAVKPSEVDALTRALATRLGVPGVSSNLPASVPAKWLDALVRDLRRAGNRAVVIPGTHQIPSVHALAHAINLALGSVGTTVSFRKPALTPANGAASLSALAKDLEAGRVDVLLVLGGNPVYGAPADVKLADLLPKAKFSLKLGMFDDETNRLCRWSVPETHFLEAWGDLRATDGTVSIAQPLILPLYSGARSAIEMLSVVAGAEAEGMALVQATWMAHVGGQKGWDSALNKGVVPNTRSAAVPVTLNLQVPAPMSPVSGMEVVFLPDPTIWDGRYSNNGWMQELPKPLTKLTWDNAVHLSPRTAEKLGVNDEEQVEVRTTVGAVTAPVFVMPGHPDDVATLHLGYGRTACGKVGVGPGFNFGALRSAGAMSISAAELRKMPGKYPLASAQLHHSMEGRDILREGTVAAYREDPKLRPKGLHEIEHASLYNQTEEWAKSGLPQWGMTIDLDKCVGCNACVAACQSENNIPSVGKLEVQRGREMHWIRIDRYYRVTDAGKSRDVTQDRYHADDLGDKRGADLLDPSKVTSHFQPVPCMHCETAPCEPVCPVAATVHSHEGLNQMVYNRCVGTRYCSNNCPYKVRRFNFFNYQHGGKNLDRPYGNQNYVGEKDVPLLRLINNPDVTVRSRGVMEKCTYCVQRINTVRIHAKKEGRDIEDGEIVPACAQACPGQAITFGNLADKNSRVSQLKAEPRNYGLLAELNTVPRTTYLGRLRNPNPELVEA